MIYDINGAFVSAFMSLFKFKKKKKKKKKIECLKLPFQIHAYFMSLNRSLLAISY